MFCNFSLVYIIYLILMSGKNRYQNDILIGTRCIVSFVGIVLQVMRKHDPMIDATVNLHVSAQRYQRVFILWL